MHWPTRTGCLGTLPAKALPAMLLSLPLLLMSVASPAAGQGFELAAHAGVFNVARSSASAEAGLEVRFPAGRWGLVPVVGAAGTDRSAYYLTAGLRRDLPLAPRWRLAPGLGVALYEKGDDKDLGGSFQFRSMLELSYAVSRRSRLGVVFYHLSNAGLDDLNPGSNSLVLNWAVELTGPAP